LEGSPCIKRHGSNNSNSFRNSEISTPEKSSKNKSKSDLFFGRKSLRNKSDWLDLTIGDRKIFPNPT